MTRETAVFAGGCFWCTEAVFQSLAGVDRIESGYTGGTVPNPTYKQVCGGDTGHAEAIRIAYDPAGRYEERRGGKEGVSTCSTRWSPYPKKQNSTQEKKRN